MCFLVVAQKISCPMAGMWDLSSLTRNRTGIPYNGRQILDHWTTGDVPRIFFINLKIFILNYTYSHAYLSVRSVIFLDKVPGTVSFVSNCLNNKNIKF